MARESLNFLDVIQFLGDSVRSDLEPAVSARGGFDALYFRGDTKGQIEIAVVAAVTSHASQNAPDEYRLKFQSPKSSAARRRADGTRVVRRTPRRYLARQEFFKFKRTRGRGRRIEISGQRAQFFTDDLRANAVEQLTQVHELGLRGDALGLAALPRLSDDEGGKEIRKLSDMFAHFRVFDVDVRAAREPAAPEEAPVLRDDASNLASFLLYLSRDEEEFASLVDDACAMVPGLVDIHFESVGGAGEAVAVRLEEEGLRGWTPLGDASYGTVRSLSLLALLYDPGPPLLTCIEEIDHGLHPYVFDRLIDRLRVASERSQFLIATHSPALVNRLKADELIVCERDPNRAHP